MKLKSIRLDNFRQFAGEQVFCLDSDDIKPVSLLFGANGSGKTTFLNAFTWALYGIMSDDVEHQQRLVTDAVWRSTAIGERAEVGVELHFEHESAHYRLRRHSTLKKMGDDQPRSEPEIQLWRTHCEGSSELIGAPQETINSMLPRGVSRFFFFNGERIENLVKKGAYAEVKKDIKVLLDLEHVERAISHLPKVNRRLTDDLKKFGGQKASEIQSAIDSLTDEQTELSEKHIILTSDLATLNEEQEAVSDALRQQAESAPVQARRDETERDLASTRKALEQAMEERNRLIATRGFLAFTDDLGERTQQRAAALYEAGALPAPLKREFVDKLLEEAQCICGSPLHAGTDHHEAVLRWRQRAGLQEVETAWQKLSGQIAPLSDAREQFRDALAQTIGTIQNQRERINTLEELQSELDGKLKDARAEGIQDLETKRVELRDLIREKQRLIGAVEHQLSTLNQEIERRTKERSRAEVTDELAEKARSRSDLVQSVKRALEEILRIRERSMRERLDEELKKIFATITHQNHIPTLNEGFELTLHKEVEGVKLPVPKSTGESQILSLSFVAAVSKLAREIRGERRAEGERPEDSGTYPIVMDAAFGSLDEDYQEAVAASLARMAPQLVVLVSKSQGLGKVVQELLPFVSHLGVIETHTTAPGAEGDSIELRGHSYPYIEPSDTDYSELKEIK